MGSESQTLLVTGGAGFIGANFIHYWLEHHPQDGVVNFDKLTYAGNLESLRSLESNAQYSFVQGDICDPQAVDKAMENVDIVVHFAAETHVDRSILEPAVFLLTNVIGTQVLLNAALKHNVRRFHHVSTDEVFGSLELESTEQFSESTPYDPRSPYSASKAGSDHLVRAYGETYGLAYSITNCSNNYGAYQFPEKFISLAITNLLDNKKIPLYGDGKNVRDWLLVEDHCRAIELVLQADQGKTYVVGGLTEDISNRSVAELLCDLMGASHDVIEPVADRLGHDRRYSVNWKHIKDDLGWEPTVDLTAGLQKTIQWYTENRAWWEPLKKENADFFAQNYAGRDVY